MDFLNYDALSTMKQPSGIGSDWIEAPKEEPSWNLDVGKRFYKSTTESLGLLSGAAAALSSSLGYDKGRDFFIEKSSNLFDTAEAVDVIETSLKDIVNAKGIGNTSELVAKKVAETLVEYVPTFISMFAGGAGGAQFGAKIAGKAGGRELVEKMLAKSFKNNLDTITANTLASGVKNVSIDELRKQAIKATARNAGALAGMAAYEGTLEGGGMFLEDVKTRGAEAASPGAAALGGATVAGISMLSPLNRVMSSALGKQVVTKAGKRVLAEISLGEATEEVLQESVSILHKAGIDPNMTVGEAFSDEDARYRLAEAGIAGALVGTVYGGTTHLASQRKSNVLDNPDEILKRYNIDAKGDVIDTLDFTGLAKTTGPATVPQEDAELGMFGREVDKYRKEANKPGAAAVVETDTLGESARNRKVYQQEIENALKGFDTEQMLGTTVPAMVSQEEFATNRETSEFEKQADQYRKDKNLPISEDVKLSQKSAREYRERVVEAVHNFDSPSVAEQNAITSFISAATEYNKTKNDATLQAKNREEAALRFTFREKSQKHQEYVDSVVSAFQPFEGEVAPTPSTTTPTLQEPVTGALNGLAEAAATPVISANKRDRLAIPETQEKVQPLEETSREKVKATAVTLTDITPEGSLETDADILPYEEASRRIDTAISNLRGSSWSVDLVSAILRADAAGVKAALDEIVRGGENRLSVFNKAAAKARTIGKQGGFQENVEQAIEGVKGETTPLTWAATDKSHGGGVLTSMSVGPITYTVNGATKRGKKFSIIRKDNTTGKSSVIIENIASVMKAKSELAKNEQFIADKAEHVSRASRRSSYKVISFNEAKDSLDNLGVVAEEAAQKVTKSVTKSEPQEVAEAAPVKSIFTVEEVTDTLEGMLRRGKLSEEDKANLRTIADTDPAFAITFGPKTDFNRDANKLTIKGGTSPSDTLEIIANQISKLAGPVVAEKPATPKPKESVAAPAKTTTEKPKKVVKSIADKTAERKEAKQEVAKEEKAASGGITSSMVRDADGELVGHQITDGTNTAVIFRDTDSGWWYDEATVNTLMQTPVGFTKAEAIAHFKEKWDSAKKTPEKPKTIIRRKEDTSDTKFLTKDSDTDTGIDADELRGNLDFNDVMGVMPVVHIEQSVTDLPQSLQEDIKKYGKPVLGAFHKGEIYLIADNITSVEEAQRALLHEGRHAGLSFLLGKDFRTVMTSAYKVFKNEVNAYMTRNDLEDNIGNRLKAAEEVLVDKWKKGVKHSFLNRVIQAIQRNLRKLFPSLSLSKSELMSVITNVDGFIETRENGNRLILPTRVISAEEVSEVPTFPTGKVLVELPELLIAGETIIKSESTLVASKLNQNPDTKFLTRKSVPNTLTEKDVALMDKLKHSEETVGESFIRHMQDTKEIAKDWTASVILRLERIAPKISAKLMKAEADINLDTRRYGDVFRGGAIPAWKLMKKHGVHLLFQDYATNQNAEGMRRVLKSVGADPAITDDIAGVWREIGDGLQEVGLLYKRNDFYIPRRVKDLDGLLAYTYTHITQAKIPESEKEAWTPFIQIIRAKEKAEGRELSPAEQKQALADYFKAGESPYMKRPGLVKERTIKHVTSGMQQFYHPFLEAMQISLTESLEAIHMRKMLGSTPLISQMKLARTLEGSIEKLNKLIEGAEEKDKAALIESRDALKERKRKADASIDRSEEALNDSIAGFVMDTVKPEHQQTAIKLISGRLKQKGVHGPLGVVNDITYGVLLGGAQNALTQIGDQAINIFNEGPFKTFREALSAGRALYNGTAFVKKYFDMSRSQQDFPTGTVSHGVDLLFRLSGLKGMDLWGKETTLRLSLKKYAQMAKRGDFKSFEKKWGDVLPDIEGIFEDLRTYNKNGELTDNILRMMFARLGENQSIMLSNSPHAYLVGGNLRSLWMLKKFQLTIINRAVHSYMIDTKSGNHVKAFVNMASLVTLLVLSGAGLDELKDWIAGRDEPFSDTVADNFVKLFLLNRYGLDKGHKTDSFFTTLFNGLLPPVFKGPDAVWADAKAFLDDEVDFKAKSLQFAPVFGNTIYSWLSTTKESRLKRNKSSIQREFNEGAPLYKLNPRIQEHNRMAIRDEQPDLKLSTTLLRSNKRKANQRKKKKQKARRENNSIHLVTDF